MITTIDLHFLGRPRTIASFLIESRDGLVLVETGPHSCHPDLLRALKESGASVSDVRHVLLTHIHLDHSGGAWALAEKGATIHVHPFGLRHLANPEKLVASAGRIFGKGMERLWGEIGPVAPELLAPTEDRRPVTIGGIEFVAWHTPGHARHHIAWQYGDAMFTGDVLGVAIGDGPVMPPCPPPDIDLDLWKRSLEIISGAGCREFHLTHYGRRTDLAECRRQIADRLDDWLGWVSTRAAAGRSAAEMTDEFIAHVHRSLLETGLTEEEARAYHEVNPLFMTVLGLYRHWEQRKGS